MTDTAEKSMIPEEYLPICGMEEFDQANKDSREFADTVIMIGTARELLCYQSLISTYEEARKKGQITSSFKTVYTEVSRVSRKAGVPEASPKAFVMQMAQKSKNLI